MSPRFCRARSLGDDANALTCGATEIALEADAGDGTDGRLEAVVSSAEIGHRAEGHIAIRVQNGDDRLGVGAGGRDLQDQSRFGPRR